MFEDVRNRIEQELPAFIKRVDEEYALKSLSPLLFSAIQEFILREGKRVRPTLFVAGYLGFTAKRAAHLYTSALSIELLHDFMLVHDDIIDRSDLRRNKPSAHALFNAYLKKRRSGTKVSGEDLALIMGDVMYAIAIRAFLSIDEPMERKERALKEFLHAAVFTGCGEFIELMHGITPLQKLDKESIYAIYDYKTAYYTFSCPLATGAILAGAPRKEVNLLLEYGRYLGRGFQIKDDIMGMFEDEATTGKSALTDLKESKKTLLLWQAYREANKSDRDRITALLNKKAVSCGDLMKMREIVRRSGALIAVQKELRLLLTRSQETLKRSAISAPFKQALLSYAAGLLSVDV